MRPTAKLAKFNHFKKNVALIPLTVSLWTVFSFTAFGAGELDPGFHASVYGGVYLNSVVNAVKVQPDGKILFGGHFTEVNGFAASGLARLNPNGTIDSTFTPPDFFNGFGIGREIKAIAIQSDGKILVGGDFFGADNVFKLSLMRLNADGSIDTSFNNYNLAAGSIVFDIEVQPDNKILVGGLVCGIFRLNSDGSFDNAFTQSLNGGGSGNGVEDIDLQADGKIVMVGRNLMRRVTVTGAVDASFDQSNIFSGGTVTTVKVRTDGKILVGGSFQTINATVQRRLCLFNSNGTLDTTFSPQGRTAALMIFFSSRTARY
jgi:uncharacterized delta-60 repeat protein